jgi:hypothetical protein
LALIRLEVVLPGRQDLVERPFDHGKIRARDDLVDEVESHVVLEYACAPRPHADPLI